MAKAELEFGLQNLAIQLKLNESDIEGKVKAQVIFDYLQEHGKYSLDRCCITGTAPNFSLVIFLNNLEPPFNQNVIPDFAALLQGTKITIQKLDTTCIHLKSDSFQIDLYPAPNYVTTILETPKLPILAAKQALKTLQKIQENPKNTQLYSASLAESEIEFRKQQSQFANDLIRICRYWAGKINFGANPINGIGYSDWMLVELIAIKAAQDEQSKISAPSILSGFENFLRFMELFSNLGIEFPNFDPLEKIREESTWRPFLGLTNAVKIRPYVIQPGNRFNNLAPLMSASHLEKFKMAARKTSANFRAFYPSKSKSVENLFEQ